MSELKKGSNLSGLLPERNLVVKNDLIELINGFSYASLLRNKTILVSGGGGFLPSFLIKALLSINLAAGLGLRVICVARRYESVQFRLGDWISDSSLKIILHDVARPLPDDFPEADIIVHAASQASPKFYGSDPVGTIEANAIGTQQLLNHAVKCKSDKFLYFSSGEVYGIPKNGEIRLSEMDYGYLDPVNVRSCYAESKRLAETMCVAWSSQHNVNASIVRPFHTYGPGMALDDGRVFADFVSDIVQSRDIVIKSDGLAMRSFCYIKDATEAFLMVLLFGKTAEAYNIGNPDAEISIGELAELLTRLFPDRKVGVIYSKENRNGEYLASSVVRSYPSIDKVGTLGWSPNIGLEIGFKRTVESFL